MARRRTKNAKIKPVRKLRSEIGVIRVVSAFLCVGRFLAYGNCRPKASKGRDTIDGTP